MSGLHDVWILSQWNCKDTESCLQSAAEQMPAAREKVLRLQPGWKRGEEGRVPWEGGGRCSKTEKARSRQNTSKSEGGAAQEEMRSAGPRGLGTWKLLGLGRSNAGLPRLTGHGHCPQDPPDLSTLSVMPTEGSGLHCGHLIVGTVGTDWSELRGRCRCDWDAGWEDTWSWPAIIRAGSGGGRGNRTGGGPERVRSDGKDQGENQRSATKATLSQHLMNGLPGERCSDTEGWEYRRQCSFTGRSLSVSGDRGWLAPDLKQHHASAQRGRERFHWHAIHYTLVISCLEKKSQRSTFPVKWQLLLKWGFLFWLWNAKL